jgi:hypothetical protein
MVRRTTGVDTNSRPIRMRAVAVNTPTDRSSRTGRTTSSMNAGCVAVTWNAFAGQSAPHTS